MFQTQFFNGSHSIKHNLVCYLIPCYVSCAANAKVGVKQTQPNTNVKLVYRIVSHCILKQFF